MVGLPRVYQRVTGTAFATSSLYAHFTPALMRLLSAVLAELIARQSSARANATGQHPGCKTGERTEYKRVLNGAVKSRRRATYPYSICVDGEEQ